MNLSGATDKMEFFFRMSDSQRRRAVPSVALPFGKEVDSC